MCCEANRHDPPQRAAPAGPAPGRGSPLVRMHTIYVYVNVSASGGACRARAWPRFPSRVDFLWGEPLQWLLRILVLRGLLPLLPLVLLRERGQGVICQAILRFGHKDPSLARQLHGRPAVSHTTLFQVLLVVFFGSVEG